MQMDYVGGAYACDDDPDEPGSGVTGRLHREYRSVEGESGILVALHICCVTGRLCCVLVKCHCCLCPALSYALVRMLVIYMDSYLLFCPGTFGIFGIAAMYEAHRMPFILRMLVYLLGRKAGLVGRAVGLICVRMLAPFLVIIESQPAMCTLRCCKVLA